MTRRSLAAVAVLLSIAVLARAQPRGAVDWVFLVDTSASMRGVGGTKDIFGDVQASIETFVRQASDGDSVAIYTFDRDVRMHSAMNIAGSAREDLATIVDGLAANGNRTHLGQAISKGLERAEWLRANHADPTRVRAVVLFTDGKEDVRGIPDPIPILSNLRRVGDSFVFFVSMGEHEPQLDQFATAAPRTNVLRAPSRESIHQVAQEIRAKLPRPEPPPPPVLGISPSAIAFGRVKLGKTSEVRALTITSDRPVPVVIRVEAPIGVTAAPIETLSVGPGKPATATLQLEIAKDASAGLKQLTIHAGGARAAATVEVMEPSVLARIARWLVVIALVCLAAFLAFTRQRKKNRLEGELEILQPRLTSDAAYVGLPSLHANEVVLSAIVPPDALAGSDARLFVRRTNGEKKVWIASQKGSLRINDVETPTSELYDTDTIQIGDAKLRFNRAGHERVIATQEDL